MPVMRERHKEDRGSLYEGGDDRDLQIKSYFCRDVNNGRLRPNSPCAMRHAVYSPLPIKLNGDYLGRKGYINAPPYSVALSMETLFSDHMGKFNNDALSMVNKVRDAVSGRFSTLNFAYELREIDDLFKSFLDRRARYITYAFGIKPMVGDLVQLWNDVDLKVASLNKKLEAFVQPYPINWGYSAIRSFERSASYFLGNEHQEYVDARCKSRIVGTIHFDVPFLARANPLMFDFLDRWFIDLSAQTAWEAVPFSWLVDWFLPVGNVLGSLGSLVRPDTYFTGTIAHRIGFTVTIKSLYSGPAYAFPAGEKGGSVRGKNYYRVPFDGAAGNLAKWDIFPSLSAHQIALIRDIIYRPKSKEWRTPPRKLDFRR